MISLGEEIVLSRATPKLAQPGTVAALALILSAGCGHDQRSLNGVDDPSDEASLSVREVLECPEFRGIERNTQTDLLTRAALSATFDEDKEYPFLATLDARSGCVDDLGNVWLGEGFFEEGIVEQYDADLELLASHRLRAGERVVCGNEGIEVVALEAADLPDFPTRIQIRSIDPSGSEKERSIALGRSLGTSELAHLETRDGFMGLGQSPLGRIDPEGNAEFLDDRWAEFGRTACLGSAGTVIFTGVSDEERTALFRWLRDGTVEEFYAPNSFEESSIERVACRPGGGVLFVGEASSAEETGETFAAPRLILTGLDADGTVEFELSINSPERVTVTGLEVTPAGEIWCNLHFYESVWIGGMEASGRVPSRQNGSSPSYAHQALAIVDELGQLRHLEGLAPTNYLTSNNPALLPLGAERGLFVGAFPGGSDAQGNPLPFRGVGTFEFDRTLASALPVPVEELSARRITAPRGTYFSSVAQSSDGTTYMSSGRQFSVTNASPSEYFSGEQLPAYDPKSDNPGTSIIDEGRLFYLDWGDADKEELAVLRVLERGGETWELKQELVIGDRYAPSVHSPTLLSSHGWVFLGHGANVATYRFEKGRLTGPLQTLRGARRPVHFDGTQLVTSDTQFERDRAGAGAVHVYRLSFDSFSLQQTLLSDFELEYVPPLPSGDYVEPAPPGQGFGSFVAALGETIVVTNQEHTAFFFEKVAGAYVLEQKLGIYGQPYFVDSNLLAFADPSEPRGVTTGSGAVYLLERAPRQWEVRRRIVPSQRFQSWFGSTVVRAGNSLLIGAPGYGSRQASQAGAIFELSLQCK